MQRTKELNLDGRQYVTTQYNGVYGWKLLTRIIKIFGKTLVSVFVASGGSIKALLQSDVLETLAPGIESISSQLEEDTLVNLWIDILKTTQIKDTEKGYRDILPELDFAGSYIHTLKLVKEVFLFQYASSFFGDSATASKSAGRVTTSPIKARG